jgi:hypothetical protein
MEGYMLVCTEYDLGDDGNSEEKEESSTLYNIYAFI